MLYLLVGARGWRTPSALAAGLVVMVGAGALLMRHHEPDQGTQPTDRVVVVPARVHDMPYRERAKADLATQLPGKLESSGGVALGAPHLA